MSIAQTNAIELQSPTVLLRLVKGDPSRKATEASSTPAPKSLKKLLTTSAPTLDPSIQEAKQKVSDFFGQLSDYMEAILEFQIKTAQDTEKVMQSQNEIGKSMLKLNIEQTNKAQEALKKFEAALEAAKHESFWQKVAGAVAGSVLCFVGMITLDPALAIMGAFIIASTMTNATQKLEGALPGGAAEKAGLMLLMAVGAAIVTCGVTGLAEGVEADSEAEAAEAADAAAAAANGAAPAAGNGAAAAANAADENVEETSYLSRALKRGFKNPKYFLGQTMVQTVLFNPFTDLTLASIEAYEKMSGKKVGDKTKQLVSEVVGMVAALAAAVWGGSLTVSAQGDEATGLAKKAKDFYGEKRMRTIKTGFELLTAAGNVTGAGLGIAQGVLELKMADILRDRGAAKKLQTLYQALLDMSNAQVRTDLQSEQATNNVFANINSRWDSFVRPYVLATQFMV